jgi:hypothetical protein
MKKPVCEGDDTSRGDRVISASSSVNLNERKAAVKGDSLMRDADWTCGTDEYCRMDMLEVPLQPSQIDSETVGEAVTKVDQDNQK